MSLEGVDAWLAAAMAEGDTGLGAQLSAMHPTAIFDDLLGGGFVSTQLSEGRAQAVWQRLEVAIGVTPAWVDRLLPVRKTQLGKETKAEEVAFAAASWCLCVEYVDDLRRPPVASALEGLGKLPPPVVATCREVAVGLRERHPTFYKRTADTGCARIQRGNPRGSSSRMPRAWVRPSNAPGSI